jgi:hypothetical protein
MRRSAQRKYCYLDKESNHIMIEYGADRSE